MDPKSRGLKIRQGQFACAWLRLKLVANKRLAFSLSYCFPIPPSMDSLRFSLQCCHGRTKGIDCTIRRQQPSSRRSCAETMGPAWSGEWVVNRPHTEARRERVSDKILWLKCGDTAFWATGRRRRRPGPAGSTESNFTAFGCNVDSLMLLGTKSWLGHSGGGRPGPYELRTNRV